MSTTRGDELVARIRKIGDQDVVLEHNGAGGNKNRAVAGGRAVTSLALAVTAALGFDVGMVAQL